ncbi:MAG: hypothetical protein JJE40_05480 [Vicinamibacteria bacterium]|nr:hypothetical protein [Vicinamibacteria bacterium]
MSTAGRVLGAVLGAGCWVLCATVPAAAQMPDPRSMHGQAIPSGELPPGSVTVRVVRQALGNNLAGVAVELHGAGDVRRATTAADGRAQFSSVPAGARVHATAAVEGERLESTIFDVPAAGGVRTILVAGLGLGTAGSAPTASPQQPAPTGGASGGVSFGNNTRFAIEFQDDTIAVFYLLEIVNNTGAPASPAAPLVITLPAEAVGASLLEGASPLAAVSGLRVSIAGPLPFGATAVPIAFRVESWGPRHEFAQVFPLALDQVAVGVQRLNGLTIESLQASSMREASLSGQAFLIASGPSLPAGTALRVTLAGLPHKSPLPLYTALALAVAVGGVGVWLAMTPGKEGDDGRRRLEARRARGLATLAALDADHRAGRVPALAYQERRARLLADLERVYGALDLGGVPPGGGHGLAA